MTCEQHSLTVYLWVDNCLEVKEVDDCLDVSNKPFYKRQKIIIPTTVGTFLGPKNYADADVALKLWWCCNYINYGIERETFSLQRYSHVFFIHTVTEDMAGSTNSRVNNL